MLAEASLLVALTVQRGPGAEACLGDEALKRNVEKRLSRQVFAEPPAAQLRFSVTYARRGTAVEARVEVGSSDGTPRGSRTLVAQGHCSRLDDALSLSVALLADQPPEPEPPPDSESAAPSAPAPAPSATGEPPAPQPPRSIPTPIRVPDDVLAPREPWHVAVGVAVHGAWGALPGLAEGGSAYVSLLPPHVFPVILSGEAFASRKAMRDGGSGARFRLLRVGLSLCPPLLARAERELALCFGQKIGWLGADGFGFDHDLSERRLTYALHAAVEARQRLFSPVSLRGSLGAEVPLVRDRFVSSGREATELFRPAAAAFTARVGLEATLW